MKSLIALKYLIVFIVSVLEFELRFRVEYTFKNGKKSIVVKLGIISALLSSLDPTIVEISLKTNCTENSLKTF